MPAPALDHQQVRRGFARATTTYSEYAVLQREVERRLLEHLDEVPHAPERILDIGCGLGNASLELKKRWPKAQVVAMDSCLAMAQHTRRAAGRWRPRFTVACADTRALPFARQSFDLVFSSLCMPWVEDFSRLVLQWRNVLSPDGYLLCSGVGPSTLEELGYAFAESDPDAAHIHGFASTQLIGDTLLAAGFRNPVLLNERFTLTYPTVRDLLQDLRMTGSTNALQERRRSLTGKSRLSGAIEAYEQFRDADGVLPSTCEVIYIQALAHKPRPEPDPA
ncbi:MAG: malonyl-ACP O-methyltransferase BioC [Rhodanobacter sp.]